MDSEGQTTFWAVLCQPARAKCAFECSKWLQRDWLSIVKLKQPLQRMQQPVRRAAGRFAAQ